jgi:ABC-type transport system involved in multi-copper enzyme maturation permease subunit
VTVHARGYRKFEGSFGGAPAWWVILRTCLRTTMAGKGMRFLGVLLLLWFVIVAVALYVQVGSQQNARQHMELLDTEDFVTMSRTHLLGMLVFFYSGVTGLVSLLAIFSGAGLVAEDLQARALTLYLVRPIRALDYALGKALVVPWVLLMMSALPGVFLWLLVGAWQMPGETGEFWSRNMDILGMILRFLLVAGGAFTGLVLLLSASTTRRAVVSSLAATVIFGGTMVAGIGARVQGTAGDVMRLMGIPVDAISPFLRATIDEALQAQARRGGFVRFHDPKQYLPDPTAAAVLAAALFAAGFLRVWLRARSVEVTE